MIYLFNDVKELTGTVRNNHILNLLYEREKNGIYSVSAEIPVTYNDQGAIYNYNKKVQKSDFLGHYDKEGRFQLHKIAAVDIENGSIFVKGIHIFFDEAKAGAIIKDRRFVDREIIDGARVAFESIGWSVADFDVSVGKTYNFYNVTPLEARQILVETFGFEFDYWLDFDGKKVTNRHVAVKEKIGEKTNKRYTYGHNVLNIRAEQDYSEIYTAVIGRGKGEEIEETGGYGRRIEYTDVVWTTPSKPLNKPAGSRVLEDPNATQLFGYKENGVVKPRIKVEVFSDIESPTELIQASYDWLMDNNVPKAVFSLKVADGDGLNLGDEVYVIYRDIDLVKSARVEKVIDDLVSGNRDVEFGDTAYFDTDRRLSGLRKDLERHSGETGDRIYQLKMEFNRRFDEEVSSWVAEFEQNLIDQKALIEADRENMTNLINTTRNDWTDTFNAEVAEIYRKADEDYNRIETEITETIDSTREEMETEFNESVQSAHEYADSQIADKEAQYEADWNQRDADMQQMIETVVGGSIESLDTNLLDVNSRLLSKLDESDLQPLYGRIDDAFIDISDVSGELSSAREGLQAQLDEARAELDGIEVGGRNYLAAISDSTSSNPHRDAKVEDGIIYWTQKTTGSSPFSIDSYAPEGRGDYVFSFKTNNSENLRDFVNNREGGTRYTTPVIKEQNGYFHVSLVLTNYITHSSINFYGVENFDPPKEVLFWDLKLEKGTIATDWTPAPEDTEQKITTLNQQIEFIDGQLSAKLEQTDIQPIQDKITEYGTTLDANAESIGLLQDKTELHDGDITKWSNLTESNAEEIGRTLTRISDIDGEIERAQTRITTEAGRLDALFSQTSTLEGKLSDAELAIEANAEGLSLKASITEVEQAIDGIEVGGRNLLLDSDKYNSFNGSGSPTYEMLEEYKGKRNVLKVTNPGGYIIFNPAEKYSMPYEVGQEYNVSFSAMYEGLAPTNEPTIYMSGASGGYREFNNSMNDVSFTRINRTFTPSAQSTNRIHMNFSGYGVVYIVMDFMVVRGNLPMDWTPAPEDTEQKITQLNTDITVEAGRINGLLTRTSEAEQSIADISFDVDGITADFANYKQDVESDVGALSSQVASYESSVDGFRAEVGTLQGNMDDLESWRNDKGSLFEQAAEGFRQRVWTRDIDPLTQRLDGHEAHISDLQLTADSFGVTIGEVENGLIDRINGIDTWYYNLLRGSRLDESDKYTTWSGSVVEWSDLRQFRGGTDSSLNHSYIQFSEEVTLKSGKVYTLSFDYKSHIVSEMDSIYLMTNDGTSNVNITHTNNRQDSNVLNLNTDGHWQRAYIRFTVPIDSRGEIRIGTSFGSGDTTFGTFDVRLPYLTETERTQWMYHQLDATQNLSELTARISNFEQTIDQISATVQDIDQDVVKQSQVYVGASGVQIGSTYLGDSDFASIFRVSPRTIDAVAEQMRVSGDLYVKGEIQSFAMEAVEGEFARLWADEFEAITIDAEMITSGTMSAERIRVGHAFVNRIMGQSVFADEVTAITGNFIDLNAGNIVTAGLSANVITADHIQVGTALVDKMFATSARIDELITKTHFVNEMNALTLNVVDLNASEIRSRLLTANTIEAEWIKSGTALLDRVFSSTAMFERMMAKSGFVTTLNTVTIDTDQITIRRPDGGMLINNGVANWDFDVQMEEFMETTGVEWNGQWYETKRDTPTRVKIGSFKHSGTQLKLNIMIRLSGSSPAASELMFVTVRSFGGSLDYNVRRQYQVYRSSSQSKEFKVNLGVPEYGASMFYLEFQRDPLGTNSENIVQVRCNRAWQDG